MQIITNPIANGASTLVWRTKSGFVMTPYADCNGKSHTILFNSKIKISKISKSDWVTLKDTADTKFISFIQPADLPFIEYHANNNS